MPRPSLKLKQELIKASAGAGKTTALINTLMSFISDYYKEKKVFPRVVVSTFTRKATRELKERMLVEAINRKDKKIIEYISYSPHLHISTLHGIFSRFIQNHGYKIGLSPGVKIVNEFESDELIISILKNIILKQNNTFLLNHYSFEEIINIVKQYISHKQTTYKTAPINKQKIKEALIKTEKEIVKRNQTKKNQEALSDLKNEEAQLDTFYNLSTELQKIGNKVMEIQKRKKRELGLITINDLEVMTMEIIEKEKDLLDLKENKWDFWFLDEYQDTSPLQKKILDRLSHNSSTFIVGDPQQSIYYFRGADPSVFIEKEQEFKKNTDSQIKYLKNNYRSCPELIAFFNDFFPSEKFNNMETLNSNYNKEKIVASFILSPHITINKEEAEQYEVEKKIKNLIQEGAKPSEIVILSRQNKSLQKIAQYLKNKQIPIHLHSTGSFKKRREVIDALFLLRFLLNPHDDENLIGLFRTPYCRIPDHTLALIAKKKKQYNTKSLWDFCIYSLSKEYPIQKLKHHLENIKHIGALYSFQNALISLGFFDLSYYQDPTGVREANLWKLIYSLKESPSAGLGNLFSFIDYMLSENLKTETDQIGSSQNAVSSIESSGIHLMTIHSSKGLEFKHVILINAGAPFSHTAGFPYFAYQKTGDWTLAVKPETEDKRIKNSFHKQIIKEEENITIQEFDRLLYVALTRAKETITITSTGKPGKNSWLKRFPFFTHLKAGYHIKKHYSYFVHQS